jgi:hypothetical protein
MKEHDKARGSRDASRRLRAIPAVGRGFFALLLTAAAVTALALWATSFREVVLDRDEGVYATIAQAWAAGKLPYRDVFDHKPPGIYVIYRAVFATFGESMIPVRVVFALLTALIGVAAALALRAARPESSRAELAAVSLIAVYLQASAATTGGTANTEIPMMLFVTVAAVAALRYRSEPAARWLVVLGAASSVASLMKPVCLIELVLFAVVALAGRRHPPAARRDLAVGLAAYAAGAFAPVLATVGYFAARGGLAAAVEAVVSYNLAYAGASPVPASVRLPYLAGEVAIGFAPLLAGGVALAVAYVRGHRSTAAWFFALWSLAALVGVLSSGRPYLHYLHQLAVPLTLAAVTGVALLAEAVTVAARVRRRLAATAAGLLLLVPSLRATGAQMSVRAALTSWEVEAGRFLADSTGPGDPIFVWGASAQVYFFAGRTPASRFIYKYPVLGATPFAERARREMFDDVLAARPAAIVVVRDDGSGEDARHSDEEWGSYWVPAFGSFLASYTRTVTEPCIIYLRRR